MGRGGTDVKAIFTEALGLPEGAGRTAYLDKACGGDAGLRRRIEARLAAHPRADDVHGPAGAARTGDGAKAGGGTDATEAIEPTDPPADATAGADPQATATSSHATDLDFTSDYSPALDGPPTTAHADGVALTPGTAIRYFGDYEIRRELGRGGMGVVYQARQVSLNRPVALKMIRAGLLAGDDELRRFQNEAEAVALLDHPGIVPIYEVGEHDGQHYFSMKLVPGGSLGRCWTATGTTRGPRRDWWPRRPRRCTTRTPAASSTATSSRPTSWSTTQGHPHVTDFGLAKRVEADVELTAVRGHPRHAGLHGPRAGLRPPRRRHDGDRRLRPRRRPLRAADRPGPVRRRQRGRDARRGPQPPARAAAQAQRGRAARPGDDLPEVPGEGPAPPLPDGAGPGRRPAGLAGRPADRGAAGRAGGAGLAVVQAEAGDCGPGSGGDPGGGRRGGGGDRPCRPAPTGR